MDIVFLVNFGEAMSLTWNAAVFGMFRMVAKLIFSICCFQTGYFQTHQTKG